VQTGYTREELLAINVTTLDSSASEAGLLQLWSAGQAEPGKFPITLVSSHRRKDGSSFPIEIRISLLQGRDENLFIAVVRDISERQAAQAQLADQAQHTQSILDNMLDGVITIDACGIVQSFSKAAERIFGYASSEVIGCNVNLLMPSPHRENHDAYLRNYQAGGQARIIGIGREVEGLRKDGSLFPLDLSVSQTSHRGQTMYVGVVRDITERKRLDRMKSEFVSTVSHELRTPLTAIRGALGLITGGAVGVMPQQAEAMLKIAGNNTERLLLLINDILDMQKIESGQLAFAFETLEVTPFLRRVLEDLKSYGEQHQVRFVLTQELAGVRVFADPARLTQVMANLLSNAAKFSPPGAQVEVALSRQDRFLRMAVIDHGAGIPPEFQSRLFTRFSQADSSDTRSKGGTGLGLAITKAIVEKHGGHIAYAATAGQGSTFYVDLPLLED
jgi:PAS domain S-box-containing protein